MSSNHDVSLYFRIANPNKEINYLRHFEQKNYGVVVNAHTALDCPAIITFIRKHGLNFIIDPVTYAFSRNLSKLKRNTRENDIKKTWEKIISHYGSWFKKTIISKIKKGENLTPKDFMHNNQWDKDKIDNFVKSVIDLQISFMKDKQLMLLDLQKRAGIAIETKEIKPDFIIAPYFYSEDIPNAWFDLTSKMIDSAVQMKTNNNLLGVLCISKKALRNLDLDLIKFHYKKLDGILIWISDFKEHNASKTDLIRLVELIMNLKEMKIKVFNFYGGYFSNLLTNDILNGFVCGMNYGESKNIDLIPAGGMRKMIYFNSLHKHLIVEQAPRIWYEDKSHLCSCKNCKDIQNRYPNSTLLDSYIKEIQESEKARVLHFLYTRFNEFEETKRKNLHGLISSIENDIEKSNAIPSHQVKHLNYWKDILKVL